MASITLHEVDKIYAGGVKAVDALSLDIRDGEFMVFVGPSGCGKSTALRMVAGLEKISRGTISIGDRVVNSVEPKKRDIAMVFQNYALYPHMSVRENLAFGLRMRKTPKSERDRRVTEAARMLGLDTFLDRKPSALSGGQRQRVAMGRAIVREPQAFLMDEPLSNLDAKLRVSMRASLSQMHERLGTTTIYVTHDQIEAMTLGDRVTVLLDGRLQQVDTPQNLFEHPCNLFVASFIGSPSMNLVTAELVRDQGPAVAFGGHVIPLADDVFARRQGLDGYLGRRVVIGLRPGDFADAKLLTEPASAVLSVTIDVVEMLGDEVHVIFPIDAPPVAAAAHGGHQDEEDVDESLAGHGRTPWTARLTPQSRTRTGDTIDLAVSTSALHFFDAETGAAIGWTQPT